MPLALPDFPWDTLAPFSKRAREHPEGFVDLSVGSPVDPTPDVVRLALKSAADAPAYPQTAGTPELRAGIAEWFARRRGVPDLTIANVIPSIGSKELIALLPLMLGIGPGHTVVQPRVAYPTYEIGARLAGANIIAADEPEQWPENSALIWVNSPSNPTGQVRDVAWLRSAVQRARELGAIIVSDECYAEFTWQTDEPAPSILDPRVIGAHRNSVLAVYSLSKQSNLAGYRAGLVAGCSDLIAELLGVRKHAGLLPPTPVQTAMLAALADHEHVALQRERYRSRRDRLAPALIAAGFRIDHSEAGLYLWATKGVDSWITVAQLAELGILVVPGSFYSTSAPEHVRIALTVTDERVDAAIARLSMAYGK